MTEISLHILDIAQNSIKADAKLIEISVAEDIQKNIFTIRVHTVKQYFQRLLFCGNIIMHGDLGKKKIYHIKIK